MVRRYHVLRAFESDFHGAKSSEKEPSTIDCPIAVVNRIKLVRLCKLKSVSPSSSPERTK